MNRFQRLLADNRGIKNASRRFEVLNAESSEATIYLYDMIVASVDEAEWWGGVAAETFVKEISAIQAPTIHLRINSPGGDVFAARAMEAAIRAHSSKIVAHIDGYAASAASFVAIACDEIEIVEGGFFMIHKAWTIGAGNADDLKATASLLDQIDNTLIASYAKKTKCSAEEIASMMAAETWIGSKDAVEKGFADRIAADSAKNSIEWNFNALKENSITNISPNLPQASSEFEQVTETQCACPACGVALVLEHKVEICLQTPEEAALEDAQEEQNEDQNIEAISRSRAEAQMRMIETVVP